MWARICELVLAAWLVASPFVLGSADTVAVVVDVVCGLLVAGLAALSWWPRARRAHLGSVLVAGALAGWGYVASAPPAPAVAQNDMLVALVLALLAIVPSEASQPPVPWRAS